MLLLQLEKGMEESGARAGSISITNPKVKRPPWLHRKSYRMSARIEPQKRQPLKKLAERNVISRIWHIPCKFSSPNACSRDKKKTTSRHFPTTRPGKIGISGNKDPSQENSFWVKRCLKGGIFWRCAAVSFQPSSAYMAPTGVKVFPHRFSTLAKRRYRAYRHCIRQLRRSIFRHNTRKKRESPGRLHKKSVCKAKGQR